MKTINRIFKQIDQDGSGDVDLEEFKSIMKMMGSDLPPHKVRGSHGLRSSVFNRVNRLAGRSRRAVVLYCRLGTRHYVLIPPSCFRRSSRSSTQSTLTLEARLTSTSSQSGGWHNKVQTLLSDKMAKC
eukprot:COSAG02_NODE_796_length_17128_cov_176.587586_9_plen_128_part_00